MTYYLLGFRDEDGPMPGCVSPDPGLRVCLLQRPVAPADVLAVAQEMQRETGVLVVLLCHRPPRPAEVLALVDDPAALMSAAWVAGAVDPANGRVNLKLPLDLGATVPEMEWN